MTRSSAEPEPPPAPLDELLITIQEVRRRTTLPRSTVYALMNVGRFPLPVKTSPGRRAWVESEVAAWVKARKAERFEA